MQPIGAPLGVAAGSLPSTFGIGLRLATPSGCRAPARAYNEKEDMVLILDAANYKYRGRG
jgi:hypothetical protein